MSAIDTLDPVSREICVAEIAKHRNDMSPDAPDKDRIRGSVFTLSPWKALT